MDEDTIKSDELNTIKCDKLVTIDNKEKSNVYSNPYLISMDNLFQIIYLV